VNHAQVSLRNLRPSVRNPNIPSAADFLNVLQTKLRGQCQMALDLEHPEENTKLDVKLYKRAGEPDEIYGE
jgi:hypothetical protein